jgi:hypothetical protein
VAEDMKAATAAWEAACGGCGVDFVYKPEHDAAPSPAKTVFVVRHNPNGPYIAAAFFPNYLPERRILNVTPSYFTTSFSRVGVMRHELGHTLGYRHEHIVGIPGCNREGNDWIPLTEYDPKSVMHYFCGGAGTMELELTDLDKTGHRKLYAD